MNLLRYRAPESVPLGVPERLHQMPAGEIRDADIAHLAAAHELIERSKRLIERRESVPFVQLVEIDVVGFEPGQTGFAGANQMVARCTSIIRPLSHRKSCLGCDQHLRASAGECLTEDFFRESG